MFKKKLLVSVLAVAGVVGFSSVALASLDSNSNSGLYVGLQAGYGDNHADDANALGFTYDNSAAAGRIFAGYDFNQYLAVEAGSTYFSKTDVNYLGSKVGNIQTYALDLVGKITVPVAQNFGLYAKTGVDYLRSKFSDDDGVSGSSNTNNVSLVYGFGAQYAFTPNWVVATSFTRFNGNSDADSSDYQPNADLYAVGVSYKFNV